MAWVRIVAFTRQHLAPLCEPELATWFWQRLRVRFPRTVAAALLPDVVRLVSWVEDREAATRSFCRLLGHVRRRAGGEPLWQPMPPFFPLTDQLSLHEEVGVVLRGPSRRGLVRDPLEWAWTTRRDVAGAIYEPWVDRSSFFEQLDLEPTVLPPCKPAPDVLGIPLDWIMRASLAATRSLGADLRRRSPARHLLALLTAEQGRPDTTLLSQLCRVHPQTIRELQRAPNRDLLRAGVRCLHDPRLRSAAAGLDAHVPPNPQPTASPLARRPL